MKIKTGSRQIVVNFDPDQPRDERGQWTSVEGAAAGVDVSESPKPIGAKSLKAFRVGGLGFRHVYMAGDKEGAEGYASLHEGESVKEYNVQAKNVLVAKHHFQLYQHLGFKGTMQDAIQKADIKSMRATGGRGNSTNAWEKIQAQVMDRAKAKGYDAVIFTTPPAPARHELVIIDRKSAKLVGG